MPPRLYSQGTKMKRPAACCAYGMFIIALTVVLRHRLSILDDAATTKIQAIGNMEMMRNAIMSLRETKPEAALTRITTKGHRGDNKKTGYNGRTGCVEWYVGCV